MSDLRRTAAAIALAASATTIADAQDVRMSLLESMTPALAGSVGASADQLVRIREVLAHAEARFDRELAEAAVRVPAILAGTPDDPDRDPDESMEDRWRRAERAAARQRGRARAIESEAWAELETILTQPQRRRLARFVRLWERAQLGTPTLRIPPGWVDPIGIVHRVVRDTASGVVDAAAEGPQPEA